MKALFERIRSRPLIAVTIAYIIALAILDLNGFFGRARTAPPPGEESAITGTVVSEPELKAERLSFIVREEGSGDRALVSSYDHPVLPLRGDHVHIKGYLRIPSSKKNPGGFDNARYLSRQGIYSLLYARRIAIIERPAQNPLSLFLRTVREDTSETFKRALKPEEAGVLVPMLIGDKSLLANETKKEFNDAGIMHLLVVSGMNVAYVSIFFLCIFRLFGTRPRIGALYTIPFLIAYMMVTGATPPVVRATIMAVFVILSLALAREPLIYHSLALAALAILIADPQALFSASFQMSFAATIGIVALYAPLKKPFEILPPFLRATVGNIFAVSLAAQLAVTPLMLYYFNKLSVAALISNLIAVPLAGFITIAGIALYCFSAIPFLSGIAALAVHIPLSLLLIIVRYFSHLPWAVVYLPAPPMIAIAAYYIALFSAVQWRRHRVFPWLAGSAALLFAIIAFTAYKPKDDAAVTFLAVRQGTGAHIRFSNDTHWLIDGGSDHGTTNVGEQTLLPYLRSRGIRRIDTIVVTHPEPAHYNGLSAVMETVPVKRMIINPDYCEDRDYVKFLDFAKGKKISITEVWAGDTFIAAGTTITIISPAVLGSSYDDNALVFTMERDGSRILFTSDMSPEREKQLARSADLPPCDVLQLPGEDTRMPAPAFMDNVRPRFLIASQDLVHSTNAILHATEQQGAVTVHFKKPRRSKKTSPDIFLTQ